MRHRSLLLGVLWLVMACGTKDGDLTYPMPPQDRGGTMVAKVGPVVLTGEEIRRRAAAQSPVLLQRLGDVVQRKEFVTQQVRFELLAQEGWARGLQRDPEILATLKAAVVERLVKSELDRRANNQEVSEGELAAAYEKAREEFNKPETVRVSQIVRPVASDGDRRAARALLTRVQAEVVEAEKKGQTQAFQDAARAHSQDPETKDGGGELQFLTRPELEGRHGPGAGEALFAKANVGDLVVVDTSTAVVLFKKTGARRAITRTLDQVRAQLRARILRDRRNQAFDALIAELERKIGSTVDQGAIEELQLNPTPDGGSAH